MPDYMTLVTPPHLKTEGPPTLSTQTALGNETQSINMW